jgi:hypothetical protein
MFCGHCGVQIRDDAEFCGSCGQAVSRPAIASPSPPTGTQAAASAIDSLSAEPLRPVESPPDDLRDNLASTRTLNVTGAKSRRPWGQQLSRVIVGLTVVGVAVGVSIALHSGLFHVNSPAAAPVPPTALVDNQASPAVATSRILDQRASDCGVKKIDGSPVTFDSTSIPDGADFDRNALCGIARDAAERDERLSRKTLSDLCDVVSQTYGTADFAELERKAHENGADVDPSLRQAYAMITNCAHPEAAIRSLSSAVRTKIYSVGRLMSDGSSCVGYLEEMTGMVEGGGATQYFLFGTGPCEDRDFHDPKVLFNPIANPSGLPPGDVIRDRFAYTGPLPSEWVYQDKHFPFGGDRAPASRDAKAGAPPSASPAAPTSTVDEADAGATTVRAFYAALGRGDGEAASNFVIPEKRGAGPFAPDSISRFYGSLIEPLKLTDLKPQKPGEYLVGYQFRASSRRCQGRAIVTMTQREGLSLIDKIHPLDGC